MSSMSPTRRPIWLALVVTPLLVPFVMFLLYAAYLFVMGYNRPDLSWGGSLTFMYLFALPVGYLAMGAFGWPGNALLVRWESLIVGYVCVGSAIVGMVAFLVFIILIVGPVSFESGGLGQSLFFGFVAGLISGLIFCGVAGVPIKYRK